MSNPKTDRFIDYDIQNRVMRSPAEEWHPHIAQTDKTMDWWYVTTMLYDTAGNPYFLFWCDFQFGGQKHIDMIPGLADKVKPGQKVFHSIANLTDYTNQYHIGDGEITIMDEQDSYDLESNAILYSSPNRSAKWSYDGKKCHLSVRSEIYNAELDMDNADYIMYAKDHYNVEGFMQEGAEDDFSFYWSLPRLNLSGWLSFIDQNGQHKKIDVTGQGWIDRQWGDFITQSWEWSSLRFTNGARVNLYNFASGYQVATYQKADGTLQWFDHFTVKQNGYLKTPKNNVWVSWGWTYEFPIEIEGAKSYTGEPYSKLDTVENSANCFYEGPSRLYNTETGELVGITINESMGIKIMRNEPYGPNQH